MAALGGRVTTAGLAAALAALTRAEASAARKGVREGANDGTKAVLAAAKAHAPVETGALRKALGRTVKSYRDGKGVAGVVGPRRDAKGAPPAAAKYRRLKRRKSQGGAARYVNPANYAHLVEFGTRTAAPRPFLRPAWAAVGPAVPGVIAARVRARLYALAAGGGAR